MGPKPRESAGMACSACYYLVISSTHLSNGHFRRVKGVFRGPLCPTAANDSPECADGALGCSLEDLKALFYCELCDKQYLRHQEFDNHINSYDHAHKQRLKDLKHREFARNVASKLWKDQRKQEKALRRLHQLAQLQQETQRVSGRSYGLRSSVRAACQPQDNRDVDHRDHSPDGKPQRPCPTQSRTGSLGQNQEVPCPSPCRSTAPTDSHLISHPESNTNPRAANPSPRLGSHPQLPLPGRGERAGGRLGVSFCFSRRGPRLEPSASVFSDLEEEEREKREQMKERIKGIMEDMDREAWGAEDRSHSERFGFDTVGPSDTRSIPGETVREEGEEEEEDQEGDERGDSVKEHSFIFTSAADNPSHISFDSTSESRVSVWSRGLAGSHMDTGHTDSETDRKPDTEEGQYVCVLGRDGSTPLRWPVSLLKFTKSQPNISYSCKPVVCLNPAPQLPHHLQESLTTPSDDSNPLVSVVLTSDVRSCLQRQTRHESQAPRQKIAEENCKTQPRTEAEETKAHLFLRKHLSSSQTRPGSEDGSLSAESCARAASHPFDPVHSDSSDTHSQNPPGSRLGGSGGIRERAITGLSCKLESVTQSGTLGTCISPSRCECGSQRACDHASAPQPNVGVAEVSRKKQKAGAKKYKLGKRKRGEKEKASSKRQSARCKVRSVVSTVFAVRDRGGAAGGSCGRTRKQRESGETRARRRRARRGGSSCLLGRCEAEPVSVSVRKRRPHRSHSTGSQSQAEPRRAAARLARHSADRDTEGEGQRDRVVVTFPWRSHVSSQPFSPGYNSKLFWERGHHSNPRSFIDCCYPDNSYGSSLARKRELPLKDRKFIHGTRKSWRPGEAWEERSRKSGAASGCGDRGLALDTEQWEWTRGNYCAGGGEEGRSRTGWRSRNSRAAERDQLARFSPSPGNWGRRSRHLSSEDVDWDRCSADGWTWASSDSWEDRGAPRSTSGSGTGPDGREGLGCSWRYAGTRNSSSRHLSSPEWWTSRQTCSPQSGIDGRAGRCHSPRSCSPCSSTSMSELSWEWSRSSTCSGATVDGPRSCRTSPGAPDDSFEAPQEAKKQKSSSTSLPQSSPSPSVPSLNLCNTNASQVQDPHSQADLRPSVTVSSSVTSPPAKSQQQKQTRTLLLPLIGKLPAIQRKARRRKWLLERSRDKEGEEDGEGKGVRTDAGALARVQTHPADAAESNLGGTPPNLLPSRTGSGDKRTGGEEAAAPPISFTAEEMDKYRLLQEQAREHMQKVLERTQESADARAEYTHSARTESGGASEELFAHVPAPCTHTPSADPMQTQAQQRSLHVGPPLPQDNFPQPMALSLPPLPPSPPLATLHHIILQHTALSMPTSSSSACSSSSSSSPASPPPPPPPPAMHPAQLLHPLSPLHPHHHHHHHLHLSPFSISSLFPSILLSHQPIPLLPQSSGFHATPLSPLSPVALQPLNPQPFIDRVWPVRFQQKAL